MTKRVKGVKKKTSSKKKTPAENSIKNTIKEKKTTASRPKDSAKLKKVAQTELEQMLHSLSVFQLANEIAELKKRTLYLEKNRVVGIFDSVKKIEDFGEKVTKTTLKASKKLADDLVSATSSILEESFKGLQTCVNAAIEANAKISATIVNKAIEYSNEIISAANGFIYEIVVSILNDLGRKIEREPKPELWLLRNPKNSISGAENPDFKRIDNITNLSIEPNHILVHGIGYDNLQDAFNLYVSEVANAFELFESGSETEHDQLYLVTWKSDVLKENADLITSSLIAHGFDVTNQTTQLMLAICIAEAERRAELVANAIAPFIKELIIEKQVSSYAWTHSMGSYVWGKTLSLIQNSVNAIKTGKGFGLWYSFQAAVPSNALMPGGIFSSAGKFLYENQEVRYLANFHSETDVVLIAYTWAKNIAAMGSIGAIHKDFRYKDIDVSLTTLEAHGSTAIIPNANGYFQRLDKIVGPDFLHLFEENV